MQTANVSFVDSAKSTLSISFYCAEPECCTIVEYYVHCSLRKFFLNVHSKCCHWIRCSDCERRSETNLSKQEYPYVIVPLPKNWTKSSPRFVLVLKTKPLYSALSSRRE